MLRFFGRPKSGNRLAFAFYATNDTYAAAVLVFVHLLRELGIRSDADVVVLHLNISRAILRKMRRLGVRLRQVEPVGQGRDYFYRNSFVKFRIFELTEYDRVLFIDADSIPLQNLDSLFALPMDGPVAAPRAYWILQPYWTTAMLLVQPSIAMWRQLEGAIESYQGDMDLMNSELGKDLQSLPPGVFCLNSEWENARGPFFYGDAAEAYSTVSVVHFSAVGKPWMYPIEKVKELKPDAHRYFYDLWEKWRNTKAKLEL